jgi:hypothetical protein
VRREVEGSFAALDFVAKKLEAVPHMDNAGFLPVEGNP